MDSTLQKLVQRLSDAPTDPAMVGGKAAGLARLVRQGAPVPPGFVLTAEAFWSFLDRNGLGDTLAAAPSDTEALKQLSAGQWPSRLRSDIETSYAGLMAEIDAPVAVRSSATAEDGASASFAGQHRTLLNVTGIDAVLDAVFQCWASLYSEEAVQYRQARNVDEERLAMPVVVQSLVPAEASGVAFTIDPATGNDGVVVIEAAWGLGEGVVGGLLTPDHYAVLKSDSTIVRADVSAQNLRVVPAEGGGVRNEELPEERANQRVLTEEQAIELANLASSIEEQAGGPQDIEWALAGGTFSILQARPVTGVEKAFNSEGWVSEFDTDTQPETIWTSANVQEVLPGQLSPFSSSIQLEALEKYGLEPINRLGIKLTNDDPFFAFFYGRAFLNVTMMMDMIDQTPFASQEALMDQYLSLSRASAEDFDLTKMPHKPLWKRLFGYIKVLPRMLWYRIRLPKEIERSEGIVEAFGREDAERPIAEQSDEELVLTFEDGLDRSGDVGITHVSGGGITGSAFETLRTTTERWLDDEGGVLQAKLVTGLAGLESALPAFELWEISRLVLASDVLREVFKAPAGKEIERRLHAAHRDDTSAFRRAYAAFIEHHGHRSVMEVEASALSWEEDPPTVYVMIRNYLRADPAASPNRMEDRQRKQREEATEKSRRKLSFWQRPIFNYSLGEAQYWIASREHTKSLLVRTTDRGRHQSREIARRLVDRGKLADAFDLYHLTWTEVKALLLGDLSKDEAAALIGRRKQEEARNRTVTLPDMFRGRPTPLRPDQMVLPEGKTLEGIPVSPGRVTGKARVILDPRTDAVIEPGEVLVAPVTDAGWTPLFVAAAGVVVDTGGTLSHGSTVAREYGLPAVVNVKHGTRMIRTGQMITVDGTQGVVVLEES